LIAFEKFSKREKYRFSMFVRLRDPEREIWDGPKAGPEIAQSLFGAAKAFSFSDLTKEIGNLLSDASFVYYIWKTNHTIDELLKPFLSRFTPILDPIPILSRMRLRKSAAEIVLMRTSCSIAARSMIETMKFTHPNRLEYELAAKMEFEVKRRGAQRLSYPSVVAGGSRANTLHYISNDLILRDGDLVLVDAGCEYHGYASDITRTWPINGRFSRAQQELYELVLSVNEKCIELCIEKNSLNRIHEFAEKAIALGLFQLGIKKNPSVNGVSRFFPHFIGHYLGMDTHDTRDISSFTPLESGMVVTIEPGIYIAEHDYEIPERYRGIGIRIEDNVLIKENGSFPEVLTREVPKKCEQLEMLIGKDST